LASHTNSSAAGREGSASGGRSKVLDAWGHYAPDVISVVIVALVAFRLAPPPRITVLPIAAGLFVAVLGSWLVLRRHDRRLCEPCLASMPLDPARRAQRLGYRFRIAHIGSRPGAVAAYLAVVMGSVALPGTVGLVIWLAVQFSLIVAIRSYVTHRRLQPWCPICSADGGGSRVDDVGPVRPHDPQRV
jgi:hypothetical protein